MKVIQYKIIILKQILLTITKLKHILHTHIFILNSITNLFYRKQFFMNDILFYKYFPKNEISIFIKYYFYITIVQYAFYILYTNSKN